MAYEQKELSGSLFKNDERKTDKHPNLQGSALIDGVEYWVSGWTKEKTDGDKWISLAFKAKEQKPQAKKPAAKPEVDDIPW
jgi:hypothetical protein